MRVVAHALRQQYPATTILVCGDHDLSGKGQKAARDAAEAIQGLVVIPETVGEDWNDVHGRLGLQAVKHSLEAALNPPMEKPKAAGDAFAIVTPPDSFISRYIPYAASRTDAPLEAHEGLAFAILCILPSLMRRCGATKLARRFFCTGFPVYVQANGWAIVLL